MKYTYYLIDAFTNEPFQGAQIAVFTEVPGLTTGGMQLIARELNLSETVFVEAGGDDAVPWRLRIFSPNRELDFAGQPTIAACYALAMRQLLPEGVSRIQQNMGELEVSVEKDAANQPRMGFTITAPVRFDHYVPSARELAEILHLDPMDIDEGEYRPMISSCGNDYLVVPVKSTAALSRARFNEVRWTLSFVATLASQIVLFTVNRNPEPVDFNLRLLGRGIGDLDDPPVGSAIPAFAAYAFADHPPGDHAATMQRGGGDRRKSILYARVTRSVRGVERIKVAGHAVMVGQGEIYLT